MRYALNVAPVNGWETQVGIGHAAMAMSGAGSAQFATVASGTATMVMDGAADPVVAIPASGVAAMVMGGVGVPRVVPALEGSGTAAMVLSARHGLPDPIVRPDSFSAAHKTRQIQAANDNRIIRGARNG